MRRISLSVFMVVGCLLTSCIVVDDRNNGNLEFGWTLDGKSCNSDGLVDYIHIFIEGKTLENSGEFSCTNKGRDGVKLRDFFYPDTYNYVITARSLGHCARYRAEGSFEITNGPAQVSVKLERLDGDGLCL